MKRMLFLLLLAAVLLTGCGRQEDLLPSFEPSVETTAPITELAVLPTETQSMIQERDFSYADLEYLEFHFNSGAGGWGTVLVIRPDGSFSGSYQDSNMGIQEPEYPNGSMDLSDFSGQFSQPLWLDEHTGVLKIEDIRYQVEPGTVEIWEGIRYSYGTAYGLTETEELVLYLPGKPLAELPEAYISWANLYGYEGTELPHYGLYNPGHQSGFYAIDILDTIRGDVELAEKVAASIDEGLDEFATQADMNYAAQQKYQVWDDTLNQLWRDLKGLLSEEEMRQLTNEELAWIEEKERSALDAAAEYEGGSLYPTVYYGSLANQTKERVYELLELLPEE